MQSNCIFPVRYAPLTYYEDPFLFFCFFFVVFFCLFVTVIFFNE